MRILYHHRTLGDGAEGVHVSEMVRAFRALGHDVRVVSLIGKSINAQSRRQHRWARVRKLMPCVLYEVGEMAYNIHGYRSLSQAVTEFKPDFIYDRYASYNYSAVGAGRRYGVPVFLEVNSPYSFQRQTFDEKLHFTRLLRLFERKICRDAMGVIAVSTPLKEFLISIGVPDGKIVVMTNGVDPDFFHPGVDGQHIRRRFGLEGKVVIGFTGILRPWHGLDLLVRAFEIVADDADLHLLIVGDGPVRPDLEQIVSMKGLSEKVTITGRQPHELIRYSVAAMDISVSPRTTFYASPMKILEYMAMGKPVIAPDTQNIRDLVTHGQNGILFHPEDAASLARALRDLIGDPIFRSRLGKNARTKVAKERTWMHNARRVIQLVENASDATLSQLEQAIGHGVP